MRSAAAERAGREGGVEATVASGSGGILARYFRKEWRALGIAMLASILLALAELAMPVPLALVVDGLLEKKGGASAGFELTSSDLWLLAGAATLLLGIALVEGVVAYLSDVSLTRAGERIVHELRIATHSHLQRLSLVFHARRHTGDLVTRVTGDVNAVGRLFSESLATLLSAVLLLTGMVVVSVIIDPVLALVAFAVTPVLALVSFQARRNVKRASRVARAREGEIASLSAESFEAIREVKAFGSEPYEHGRLRSKSEERLRAGYDVTRIQSRFTRLVDLIGALGAVAVLVVGVFRVASGAIGSGELVVMVAYATKVYKPLRTIAREVSKIASSMARAERITEILATDDVLEERPGAYNGPRARGDLELDSVSFSYERDRPALVDMSLRIEAGTKLALIGRSGAGKSTIAALIARFYDPASGRVLLDGRDVRDCSLAWLRRQVGLVLQDTVLFSGSVADNIAYGIDARQEEIEAAAKAAGAHGFISELPDDYDTELGPRGVGLSGGQRQRIAIARTILRDPTILILDEPTTGLDAESEAEVLDGLLSLMEGRTTVIISHSRELLKCADRAVSIENGRITGEISGERITGEISSERITGETSAERVTGEISAERDADMALAARNLLRTALGRLRAPVGPPRALPREPAGRAPVPNDPALPRLRLLLDEDAMAPYLHRSLGPDAPFPDVRIHYVRYRPGTNAVVRYDVGLDGRRYDATVMIAADGYLARRAEKPENVALARLVNGRSPAQMPLRYEPELDALIQWYPLDLALPTLAEPPRRLLDELQAAGVSLGEVGGDPATLSYKPRRRAVLRVGGHVLKIYARQEEFAAATAALRAAGSMPGVPTPTLEADLPARLLAVRPLLSGSPPAQAVDVAREAGELLRELQAAWAPVAPPEAALKAGLAATLPSQHLATAEASARLVAAILPALGGRLETLLRELESTMPWIDRLVPSHGDFSARELLVTPGGLAVFDLDAMCLAPAAFDPAMYAAQLVSGGPDDLDDAYEVLDELLEGYGDRPPGLAWHLATCILRHARYPFRYLDERWPERVERMVAAAEAAVDA
jgi:ATP-binding cassette, subfamily B, bacterial